MTTTCILLLMAVSTTTFSNSQRDTNGTSSCKRLKVIDWYSWDTYSNHSNEQVNTLLQQITLSALKNAQIYLVA